MGTYVRSHLAHVPPKPQWSVSEMSNLAGKVMIVTGGNTGVGKETVRALLSRGAKVYLAARSESKAFAAIQDLRKLTGRDAIFLHLDLADLASVKAAAHHVLRNETKLDVLFNNAGVMFPPVEQLTADGYDLQFGTNVLGHFYFTQLLIPLLLTGASTSSDRHSRVINISSMAHSFASGIDFDTLQDHPKRMKLGNQKLHYQSKFATVVFSSELQRRYGDQGIISISLHPGNIKTEHQRHVSSFEKVISAPMLYPASMGALTPLWAGTTPHGLRLGGQYLVPWARLGAAREETQDRQLGRKLWAWLEAQVLDL
ncbi:NAD(P)-binding protein [Epithele typhae]|uniref:NAD(P)-binding protein n=1 Tax=Epithele typhae TaxID=378194 RepID=UPI0020081015|nr:NAD(P)-binding protein [Epithele typhae]KAH9942254.1 NAD(P)-binding protein [Epithele typhae]